MSASLQSDHLQLTHRHATATLYSPLLGQSTCNIVILTSSATVPCRYHAAALPPRPAPLPPCPSPATEPTRLTKRLFRGRKQAALAIPRLAKPGIRPASNGNRVTHSGSSSAVVTDSGGEGVKTALHCTPCRGVESAERRHQVRRKQQRLISSQRLEGLWLDASAVKAMKSYH